MQSKSERSAILQPHTPPRTKRSFSLWSSLASPHLPKTSTLVNKNIRSSLIRIGISLLGSATSISLLNLPVYAEGSRNLYPNPPANASARRANLEWRTSSYGPTGGTTIYRRTLLWVYANANEYILLGSSAVGRSSGNAVIYNASQISGTKGQETITGSPVFSCSAQRAGVGNLGVTQGQIADRAQELLPPKNVANTAGTGYIPCYYQAPSTGLYAIAFYGPAGANADTEVGPTGTLAFTSATNNANASDTSVYAWDVTVRSDQNSTTDIPGRLFTYSIAFFTGGNNRPLYPTIYAVTLDGFIYKTDFNAIDPNGFLTYGNSRGFLDSDGVTPLYHDVVAQSGTIQNVAQLKALYGGTNFFPPEYPLFFQSPANEVLSALSIPLSPVIPSISGVTFTGQLTGNTTLLNQGGTVSFTSTPGIYQVVINRAKDGNFDPGLSTNRVLKGISAGGSVFITWDGKDNSGAFFPVGTNYPVQVSVNGGEYHFPMIDYEASANGGPSITMLNATNPLGNTSAFYDDRSYYTVTGTIVNPTSLGNTSNPPGAILCGSGYNASFTSTPFSTSTPFNTSTSRRSYTPANNANSLCTGSFGDGKGLDLWTYYPGTSPTTYINIVSDLDYGDAPDTGTGTGAGNYETTLANGGPSHRIVTGLALGTAADADAGDLQSAGANLDDNTNTGSADDEDGISSFPTLAATSGQSYTVPVSVTNSTGSNAFLVGYIDFNRDGDFADAGEASTAVTIPSDGATNPRNFNVNFTTPVGITAGATYARFRISNTLTQVQSSVGLATSGEVEDYGITIAGLPTTYDYGDAPDGLVGTGAGNYNTTSLDSGAAHLLSSNLKMGTNAPDADSGALQNVAADADDTNNTDDEDGVTLPNTLTTASTSYSATVNVTNNIGTSATLVGWIDFNQNGVFEATEGVSQVIPDLTTNSNVVLNWTGLSNISSGTTYARFRISNGGITTATPTGLVGSGEVEDYVITVASIDYGDAPDNGSGTPGTGNYLTVAATGGPNHTILNNLFMGTAPDPDSGTLQNAAAEADDTSNTGSADDEDGATLPALAATDTTYDVTVNVTTPAGTPGYLVGWIDFNQNGSFETSEGVLYDADTGTAGIQPIAAGTSAADVTLSWSGISGLTNGDTLYARFRLTDSVLVDANGSQSVNALGNGEVEDYQITVGTTTPDLLLVKRITRLIPGDGGADVAYTGFVDDGEDRNGDTIIDNNDPGWPIGTYTAGEITVEASPGDAIEYTIYFLNTGDGAAENVRLCDLLSPYLDYQTNTYTGLTPTDGGLSTTDLGIQLTIGSNAFYLTGINDPPDRGQFVTAGITPSNCIDPSDGLPATATDNQNGAIVVDITNANFIGLPDPTSETPNPFPELPNSTGSGTPNDSYGFIRFRVRVK